MSECHAYTHTHTHTHTHTQFRHNTLPLLSLRDLQVVVVQAIHELALRLPSKHRAIMAFLANALREEGGYEFKKAILDGLLDIMEVIPESKNDVSGSGCSRMVM